MFLSLYKWDEEAEACIVGDEVRRLLLLLLLLLLRVQCSSKA